MSIEAEYSYLGRVPYPKALSMMEEHISKAVSESKAFWWGLEHEKVYTAGLATSAADIISKDIQVIPARRGGLSLCIILANSYFIRFCL